MTQLQLSTDGHTCGAMVAPASTHPSVVQIKDVPPPEGKRWLTTIRSVRLATARFSNRAVEASGLTPVRITRFPPRFKLRYEPISITELAPLAHMLKMARPEFEAAFGAHLAALNADAIGEYLAKLVNGPGTGKGVVMLCFEDFRKGPEVYCHRTMVARWLERTFGVTVEELPES